MSKGGGSKGSGSGGKQASAPAPAPRAAAAPTAAPRAAAAPTAPPRAAAAPTAPPRAAAAPAREEKKDSRKEADKPKAAAAVTVAKTFQQSTAPQKTTQSPSSAQKADKKDAKQERVASLTQKARDLLSGASDGKLADPGKFKDILGKLKNLGKGERVENLREQRKTVLETSRKVTQPPGGQPPEGQPNTGLTQEDLDSAIQNALSQFKPDQGLTQEDLDAALSSFQSQFETEKELPSASSYDWEQGYTQDLNRWMNEYKTEQEGRQKDYQSMMTDIASQEGEFDPDLFRNLLGELESSKRRQKEWNEQSAKAAYKY